MISNIQESHKLVKENGVEYYTIDDMDQVHSEMLRLLKIVDKIATENNIPYWIAGGSMIGVARHQGFIPWDDDLDIELLKIDYIKLIKCLTDYSEKNDNAFLFFPAPQVNHCCNYFASTKYFLRSQGSPTVYPVKVDIRPYNCIKNTEDNIEENKRIKDIANRFVFGKSHGIVSNEDFSKIKYKSFFYMYNNEYGLYDATKKDAVLVPPYYEYSIDFEFKYEHLFPLVKNKFEDTLVNMPKDYDYILRSIYGNYMELPKLKHRVPAACKLYNKNISLKKIKKIYGMQCSNKIEYYIKSLLFLLSFHGIICYLKIILLEKTVVIESNYENSQW